ncbi:hypothetical protein EJ06DRAFT_520181 [Trichodelitschia bisporula]|uniref:Uncharacterized protein n=1 Tax=Trichodelitschia bisporula TaxID=703511 RepID=A0A6G1I520_9PEZI|nr:hypothetical protein EJ06DRAFT_520181 [Trichodelitschia bisporula]
MAPHVKESPAKQEELTEEKMMAKINNENDPNNDEDVVVLQKAELAVKTPPEQGLERDDKRKRSAAADEIRFPSGLEVENDLNPPKRQKKELFTPFPGDEILKAAWVVVRNLEITKFESLHDAGLYSMRVLSEHGRTWDNEPDALLKGTAVAQHLLEMTEISIESSMSDTAAEPVSCTSSDAQAGGTGTDAAHSACFIDPALVPLGEEENIPALSQNSVATMESLPETIESFHETIESFPETIESFPEAIGNSAAAIRNPNAEAQEIESIFQSHLQPILQPLPPTTAPQIDLSRVFSVASGLVYLPDGVPNIQHYKAWVHFVYNIGGWLVPGLGTIADSVLGPDPVRKEVVDQMYLSGYRRCTKAALGRHGTQSLDDAAGVYSKPFHLQWMQQVFQVRCAEQQRDLWHHAPHSQALP